MRVSSKTILLFVIAWIRSVKSQTLIPEIESESGLIKRISVKDLDGTDFDSLRIFVGNERNIPVSGKTILHDNTLLFTPDFMLERGLEYNAVLSTTTTENHEKEPETVIRFSLPKKPTPKVFVKNIYPSSAEIPENILRFYIEFSAPMREGDFLSHIKLSIIGGEDLTDVFFNHYYELWNKEHNKITILVDPGRVKTGLYANQVMGRAFKSGEIYRLKIMRTWKSIEGNYLASEYTKIFMATDEDFDPVDPQKWTINKPKADSAQPLIVEFPKSVDHVSTLTYINVVDPRGQSVLGSAELERNETVFIFNPVRRWSEGIYKLEINSRMEDVVGNNLNGAFDHKIGDLKSQQEGAIETLQFKIDS